MKAEAINIDGQMFILRKLDTVFTALYEKKEMSQSTIVTVKVNLFQTRWKSPKLKLILSMNYSLYISSPRT